MDGSSVKGDTHLPTSFVIARFALLAVVVVAAIVAGRTVLAGDMSVETIRAQVAGAGVFGWLVFLVVYVAAVVLLVPATPISLLGAALFGFAIGFPLIWAGAVVGTVITFSLARFLGRPFVERMFGERADFAGDWTNRNGLGLVFFVRLVPLFPFNVVNYALGITRVRFRDYVIGTALGILPGTAMFALIGASAVEVKGVADVLQWSILLPLLGLLVLSVGGFLVAKRTRAREREL